MFFGFKRKLRGHLNDKKTTKLNLGCGDKPIENAVNVDFYQQNVPNLIVHNLNSLPYPFKDNTFDYVHLSQILEHLGDTIGVLEEIRRIAKPEGVIYIGVPHFSSRIAYADPTHIRYFAATTFSHYFKNGYYCSTSKIKFDIEIIQITFSKMYWLLGIPFLANLMPRFYEDHFAWIFPAKFINVIMRVKK